MPITRDEWERGRTDAALESRLEQFLVENRSSAFTLGELGNKMYDMKFENSKDIVGSFMSYFNIGEALRELIKEGRVRSKLIRGDSSEDVYYTLT